MINNGLTYTQGDYIIEDLFSTDYTIKIYRDQKIPRLIKDRIVKYKTDLETIFGFSKERLEQIPFKHASHYFIQSNKFFFICIETFNGKIHRTYEIVDCIVNDNIIDSSDYDVVFLLHKVIGSGHVKILRNIVSLYFPEQDSSKLLSNKTTIKWFNLDNLSKFHHITAHKIMCMLREIVNSSHHHTWYKNTRTQLTIETTSYFLLDKEKDHKIQQYGSYFLLNYNLNLVTYKAVQQSRGYLHTFKFKRMV